MAKVTAANAAGAKRKKTPSKGGPQFPAKIPSTIAQSDAKLYIPPGSSIWRALNRSAWNAHLPPYPRISEQWAIESEHGALLRILRRLWRMYNELQGRPEDECPIQGMFGASSSSG
jgi:hypothetical protein